MLIVNSFPRTANRFFANYITRHFGDQGMNYTPENMHNLDMLSDTSINQVVILRKPEDCIPSYYILTHKINAPIKIEAAIRHYIRWNNAVVKNINHLFVFTFEDIINEPLKALTLLEDSLGMSGDLEKTDDFFRRYRADGLHIPKTVHESSKLSLVYDDAVEKYNSVSDELLQDLNRSYQDLLRLIQPINHAEN
jgi:hypothetical protein